MSRPATHSASKPVDAAETLDDLRVPSGNRLEPLRGDRAGQRSTRINQQWRICFTWTPAGPENLEIEKDHLGTVLEQIHPLQSA